ncbi:hypothetical protein KXD40_006762 [Peronospora effusa]|nr:hypothetical protein KXD40_006762 [Peronospora effusa]
MNARARFVAAHVYRDYPYIELSTIQDYVKSNGAEHLCATWNTSNGTTSQRTDTITCVPSQEKAQTQHC